LKTASPSAANVGTALTKNANSTIFDVIGVFPHSCFDSESVMPKE
jgi:hypothetical protein